MPAYNASGPVPSLDYPGVSYTVWNAEQPASGTASQQVALSPSAMGEGPFYSVEISFNFNPMTFEIDIQEADTDAAVNYLGPLGGGITTVTHNGSNYVARMDLNNPVTAGFLRLAMVTAPTYSDGNTVTARIWRR